MREAELVGAWALVDFWIRFDDGRPAQAGFGPGATGWLLYSDSGRMSALLSRAQRPALSIPRLESAQRAPAAEKAQAFDDYLSYAGSWRLDGDEVVHEVSEALVPNIVGLAQRRRASLSGDLLTLSYRGGPKLYTLRWRRA